MWTKQWIVVALALVLGGAAAQAAPAPRPPHRPAAKKRSVKRDGEAARKVPSRRLGGIDEQNAGPRKPGKPERKPDPVKAVGTGEAFRVSAGQDAGASMSWGRWALWNGLTGFGVAALVVPATLALGHEIGKHPSNYLVAALPGLLLLLALPPAAVTTAEYFLGNRLKRGSAKWHPAFWTTLGVQLVTMVIAIAAGTTTHELDTAAPFAAADAVILSGTVTLMMYLTRPKRRPPPKPRALTFPTSGGRAALLSLMEERWLARRHRVQPTLGDGLVVDVLRMRF